MQREYLNAIQLTRKNGPTTIEDNPEALFFAEFEAEETSSWRDYQRSVTTASDPGSSIHPNPNARMLADSSRLHTSMTKARMKECHPSPYPEIDSNGVGPQTQVMVLLPVSEWMAAIFHWLANLALGFRPNPGFRYLTMEWTLSPTTRLVTFQEDILYARRQCSQQFLVMILAMVEGPNFGTINLKQGIQWLSAATQHWRSWCGEVRLCTTRHRWTRSPTDRTRKIARRVDSFCWTCAIRSGRRSQEATFHGCVVLELEKRNLTPPIPIQIPIGDPCWSIQDTSSTQPAQLIPVSQIYSHGHPRLATLVVVSDVRTTVLLEAFLKPNFRISDGMLDAGTEKGGKANSFSLAITFKL
ncbi:hypothetical protein BD410DRAFT_810268 [Rickenella mellea]|uniref:Uncharacterized protein n=1 Tax=Rickenella mellea TaxID=50990 RepID=A0A4Y7PEJ8_9AGAM|nr:hypothetical protein BD410DRAFT_810268 [Rickenella mellea]